jgi:hypothetical protein
MFTSPSYALVYKSKTIIPVYDADIADLCGPAQTLDDIKTHLTITSDNINDSEWNHFHVVYAPDVIICSTSSKLVMSMAIGSIMTSIDVPHVWFSAIAAHLLPDLSRATVQAIIQVLHRYVKEFGAHTYGWKLLTCGKLEYTYYQFKKRSWPVKKYNNISWQTLAKKIGLVDITYPGEAAVLATRKFAGDAKAGDAKAGDAKAGDTATLIKKDDVDTLQKNVDKLLAVKADTKADTKVNEYQPQDADIFAANIDPDNEEVSEEEFVANMKLLKQVDKKAYDAKKEEAILKLSAITNYGTYTIPNFTECKVAFEVSKLYDVLLLFGKPNLAIELVCRVLVSPRSYHLVLRDPTMMTRVSKFMTHNPRIHPMVKYAMSYSVFIMLKEERMLGNRIPDNSRAILTGAQYRALPVFNCEPEESPYFTEIYRTSPTTKLEDLVPLYLHGQRVQTDRPEFLRRLSIMTGNMFDDIDLTTFNAAITGSSLCPCVVTNPLEEKFAHLPNSFDAFVESRYPSFAALVPLKKEYQELKANTVVELDALCDSVPYSFKDAASVYKTIVNDDVFIECINKIAIEFQDRLTYKASIAIEQTTAKFQEIITADTKLSDIDVAIRATDMDDYTTKVRGIFALIRVNVRKRHLAAATLAGLPQPDPSTYHVYLYKQPVKYGFKWVLKGPGAHRCVDFFKIFVPMHKLLFSFHLNIVRFWWDGVMLRCLGSGACAALTGINQWYRWFSNNKDPMDIVLKNMQRGYSLLLNPSEITTLKLYIAEVDKYAYLRKNFVTGKISPNHVIFSHGGGVQYGLPGYGKTPVNVDNSPQIWDTYDPNLARLLCSLETNSHGGVVAPKTICFNAIANDLVGM